MAEFLHMGGYGAYVWSSFAISAVVLILSVAMPMRENKKIRKRIKQMMEQEQD